MWEYPDWDVPVIGGGMVVAIVATLHVIVAQFSVGAGFLLACGLQRSARSPNPPLDEFLYRFTKVLVLAGFVFGAVSGVAIWFSISLAATRATSILIHTFVWFWAIEWIFFLVEIVSGYALYLTWYRVTPRIRLQLAWIYAWTAWLSLAVISGILSFMLTPGKWLDTGNVWDGFLNPTFLPTVALRTVSSLALGGLVAIVAVNLTRKSNPTDRTEAVNFSARFLAPLVLMLPFAVWYFRGLPEDAMLLVAGGAAGMTLFFLFGIAASTLVGVYAYVSLIWKRRNVDLETSLLLFSIAVIATVSMEFVREGIRKPFLIYGRLYSNGLESSELDRVNETGVLASSPWSRMDRRAVKGDGDPTGRLVYDRLCAGCHTPGGFNSLRPQIAGWSRELLAYNLDRLHLLSGYMPPMVGTAEERAALVDYLMEIAVGDSLAPPESVPVEAHGSDPRS